MKVKTSKKIIGIPPVYFVSAIFLSLICYLIFPQFNLISYPSNLVGGIFLLLIGFYWIMKPHNNLEKHKTPEKFHKSTCVVITGLYKYSRNPMYLGFVIFLIGLGFFLGNIISIIPAFLFFLIMDLMFIPYEEEKMKQELTDDYLKYKKKVRRWL
jgi:protein-S-isoprenylcysteine O-methyltransferase Ste14